MTDVSLEQQAEAAGLQAELERLRKENASLREELDNVHVNAGVAAATSAVAASAALKTGDDDDDDDDETERLRQENELLTKRNFILRHKHNKTQMKRIEQNAKETIGRNTAGGENDGDRTGDDGAILQNLLMESVQAAVMPKGGGSNPDDDGTTMDERMTDHIIKSMDVMNATYQDRLRSLEHSQRTLHANLDKVKFERKAERDVWKYKMSKVRQERDDYHKELLLVREALSRKEEETKHYARTVNEEVAKVLKDKDSEMKEIIHQVHLSIQRMHKVGPEEGTQALTSEDIVGDIVKKEAPDAEPLTPLQKPKAKLTSSSSSARQIVSKVDLMRRAEEIFNEFDRSDDEQDPKATKASAWGKSKSINALTRVYDDIFDDEKDDVGSSGGEDNFTDLPPRRMMGRTTTGVVGASGGVDRRGQMKNLRSASSPNVSRQARRAFAA